jgi:murein DD-endopeptidase MepM/ murein hydrolase activator NlpD
MARRLALGLLLAALAIAPPVAGSTTQSRQSVDAKIARLNAQVASARQKEAALRSQIDGVTSEIRTLEHRVGDVSTRLAPLEHELQLREIRLNRLNALFQFQSDRLHFLQDQYRIALERLSRRLVSIYESEPQDSLSIVLLSGSLGDALDEIEYTKQIEAQDRLIVHTVRSARDDVHVQLASTKIARTRVLAETRIVAYRVRQVREVRDALLASRDRLASRRDRHRADLARLSKSERDEEDEIKHLRAADLALAGKIRAAQSSGPVDSTPSGAGLVWPVAGPITSGFGPRWGSFHYGLDIGAGYGTPIHAAAAGTVIYSGWYDGFGNFVVIDHGGALSTTYGHQSQIVVGVGEHVAQGQVIGYVGSTGFSTGPHLDFEVRINGQPVDPLGYL